MNRQLSLFSPETIGPRGLRYYPEIITPSIELDLMERIRGLPLVPFQFGAYEGKRRIASFGIKYDYADGSGCRERDCLGVEIPQDKFDCILSS